MNRLIALGLLLMVTTGCIRSPVAMMPSTKPLEQGGYEEIGPVEETDCIWYLFGFLPITTGNNLQSAMRDGIKKSGGDALIQVTAETYFQYFLVVSRYCSIVQGIAVRSREAANVPVAPKR